MQKGASIFVKIDEYRDVLDVLNLIKEKLADAKIKLDDIYALKAKEDAELENMQNNVEEVEKKIELTDQSLFEINN